MGRAARFLALGLASAALAGCGDPELWARYAAERAYTVAANRMERLRAGSGRPSPKDFARAEAAFRSIVAAHPPGRWATPEALDRPCAHDVAVVAGRSALALARLADWQELPDSALARYDRALADWGALGEVTFTATVERARVLESSGRFAEAADAWMRAGERLDPLGEPGLRQDVVMAPVRAARLLERLGRDADARAALERQEKRLLATLERPEAREAAADLWNAVAETRLALGHVDAAADAWRRVLAEPVDDERRARTVVEIGERSLEAGRPDSALAYAAWASRGKTGVAAAEALLLEGRAWAAKGEIDTALAAYERVLDHSAAGGDARARARYERGVLLEQSGAWERARIEYRALVAQHPTHDLALSALLRVVRYHAALGQHELARIEGTRAIEIVDRLIAHHFDHGVQMSARLTRARILLAMDDVQGACDAFGEFWRRYPTTREGAEAALAAAALAEGRLGDRERAARLYREVIEEASDVSARGQAETALERMGRRRG
jgi:tetratricopeptide (TPR) repeat protein